ncbi:MOSC domain-containing protein [Thiomicrorhabdus sp.]|uniref:MOSC domain-containing protein n=1 Tax=Thiomicrorhabdus sp. TaxID=2039724 RepID=UPI0029C6A4B1|nr:MOSC domain-containing protein [Thiomicrorhabdus sp.]
MQIIGHIEAVLTGTVKPLGKKHVLSGMDKHPVSGKVSVEELGLSGDEQADLRVHGGPDKAVHFYPRSHYAFWQSRITSPLLNQVGAFGENLSLIGLDESDICLADIWQIGSATFQVSQGRQPCWKLAQRFEVPDMAAQVQKQMKTGGYLRVLRNGEIEAGDKIQLLDRPYPDWPLTRLMQLFYQDTLNENELRLADELPLPASWKKIIAKRLATQEVEDWTSRLFGRD